MIRTVKQYLESINDGRIKAFRKQVRRNDLTSEGQRFKGSRVEWKAFKQSIRALWY